VLQPYVGKLYGLTIGAERLQQIRQERRPGSRYASPQQASAATERHTQIFEYRFREFVV
jgi:regulator of PEP synthase PpsR (kinase-PPPase family)